MSKEIRKLNRELSVMRTENPEMPLRLSILDARGAEVHAGTTLIVPDLEPGGYKILVHALDSKGHFDETSVLVRRMLEIESDKEPEAEEEEEPAVPVAGSDAVTALVAMMAQEQRELRAEMRAMREDAARERSDLLKMQLAEIKAAADERVAQNHKLHMENLSIVKGMIASGNIPDGREDDDEAGGIGAEVIREVIGVVKESLPMIVEAISNRKGAGGGAPE